MEYVLPSGLFIIVIGSLIATKVSLANRPTYKEVDFKYKNKEVCEEAHRRVDETLKRIEDKVDFIIKNNGYK